MLGFAALAQAPYSSLPSGLYSASATLSADSAFLSFANVLKPDASALISSGSSAAASGDLVKDALAIIASASNIVDVYANTYIGSSGSISSSSGATAYGVRYAFGGATVVGSSGFNAVTHKYTFPNVLIDGRSSIPDVLSTVTVLTQINIDSESDFIASVNYTATGAFSVNSGSALIANIREKWENEAIATEVWVNVPSTNEIWTVIPATSETWTPTH